ncbi:outer membrane beta-barrel protein [Phenylobacterium koreense]|uniref:Outer membrane protein beta-barrel domain-containing protein n=1 Tax=Phenylobacterium koreense TaxID=266125 RepID=A0ABV2EM40_9CAUL
MDFGLRAELERDNNVSRSSATQAATQGISQEDTIFTPSVTVDVWVPVGRQAVFLKGAAGYSFYDKNDQLDRERASLNGGIEGGVGPCATTLTGDLIYGQREITDFDLSQVVGNVVRTTRVGLHVNCSAPTGLGAVFGASQEWTDNSASQLTSADAERQFLTGGLSYSRPALGTVTAFTNFEKIDYPNRQLLGGGSDGYEMTAVGVSYARRLGARIEGTASISYANVEPAASNLPGAPSIDFSGTTYSGDLSYRASSRMRFRGNFSRSVTPTLAIGQQYEVQTAYGLGMDYDIGSRFKLKLGVAQNESEAHGVSAAVPNVMTSSTTKMIYGALRYEQSRRLAFTLSARHEERDANTPQFNFNGERVGIAADLAF